MHTTTPASWEELPPELFLLCFGYLPVVDLAAGCSLVCSWWYAASQQDSLWEAHFHRYRRRWQESLEGAISPAFLLNWFFPVASSFSSSSADTCSQLPVLSGIRFPMLEALATGIKRSTTFKRSCSRFILSSFLQFHVPALRHNHINKHNHQTFFKSLAWKSRVKACFHQNGLLAEPFLRWSHESSSGYSSGFSVSSSTCSCFTLEDNLLAEVKRKDKSDVKETDDGSRLFELIMEAETDAAVTVEQEEEKDVEDVVEEGTRRTKEEIG